MDPALDCVNVLAVTSEVSGNTALTNWEQLDSNDPTDILNGVVVDEMPSINEIWISLQGRLSRTVNYGVTANFVKITKIVNIKLVYNYTTGLFQSGRIVSVN